MFNGVFKIKLIKGDCLLPLTLSNGKTNNLKTVVYVQMFDLASYLLYSQANHISKTKKDSTGFYLSLDKSKLSRQSLQQKIKPEWGSLTHTYPSRLALLRRIGQCIGPSTPAAKLVVYFLRDFFVL